MKYVGLYSQQVSNNRKTFLLLALFPLLMLVLVYIFMLVMNVLDNQGVEGDYYASVPVDWEAINVSFVQTIPWVIAIVMIWFCIAYFSHTAMIRQATGSRPLERKENPRIYNMVENMTMACGMPMPKINVIDDPQLNAFASGIDEKSYTVTLTTGICDRLDDDELAGVIGHELTHIRNRDTKLLIISIVFVGILATLLELSTRFLFRTFLYGGGRRRGKNDKGGGVIIAVLVGVVLAAIGYFLTLLTRFAISRKREYMADAGGAELCGNPLALASALRKISANPGLGQVEREDVAQLFICTPHLKSGFMSSLNSLFSTHPSIESRIAYLEQF